MSNICNGQWHSFSGPTGDEVSVMWREVAITLSAERSFWVAPVLPLRHRLRWQKMTMQWNSSLDTIQNFKRACYVTTFVRLEKLGWKQWGWSILRLTCVNVMNRRQTHLLTGVELTQRNFNMGRWQWRQQRQEVSSFRVNEPLLFQIIWYSSRSRRSELFK